MQRDKETTEKLLSIALVVLRLADSTLHLNDNKDSVLQMKCPCGKDLFPRQD